MVDRQQGMSGYMLQLTTFGTGIIFDGKHSFSLIEDSCYSHQKCGSTLSQTSGKSVLAL